ncbi:MAG: hypothetical protein KDA57_19405, partial [Planctomycetales bacterium]|nr:hypothetical protein [Planctomycetales bacterium]
MLFVAFWIGLSCSAKATNFWLSATGNITSGSAPPVTPGSVEAISHDIGTQSGSIYVWARPDSGKTLVNWSLRLLSSDPSILTFASSSVETLNPVLGNTGSPEFEDIARWEYVDEPIGNNASIDDIQGINIFQVNRTGVGIGPDSTGLPYNDPFYDSSNDAWLLAQIDYLLSGTPGQTNLFLQIGEFGINNLGESSSQTTAVFGALTDAPLNGETNRKQSSQTADAVINVSALASANFDADSDIDGFDYLNWQRGFGLTSATHDQGDADGNGIVNDLDFGIWEQQLGNPPPIAETFTVPEPSTLLLVLASSCPWLFLK